MSESLGTQLRIGGWHSADGGGVGEDTCVAGDTRLSWRVLSVCQIGTVSVVGEWLALIWMRTRVRANPCAQ